MGCAEGRSPFAGSLPQKWNYDISGTIKLPEVGIDIIELMILKKRSMPAPLSDGPHR